MLRAMNSEPSSSPGEASERERENGDPTSASAPATEQGGGSATPSEVQSAPVEPAPADLAATQEPPAVGEGPIAASPVLPIEPPADEPELLEVEPESDQPPVPPSLRPETAKSARGKPLGITANLPPAGWPPKVAADLMTRKIITVRHNEPIGELDAYMEKFKFRHLPVVEEGMKLVGLITRTDLLHAKLGTMPDGTGAPPVDASTPAASIMRLNVVVARLDSPLQTACEVMLENQLSCLPVALEDGTLVGILTMTDFLKLALVLFQAAAATS